MKLRQHVPGAKPLRLAVASAAALGLLVAIPGTAQAVATAVPLGTAASFVVLGGAAIANTGPSTLNGDLGTFPTTTITGTGSITVNGTNHAGDGVTQQAKDDLTTAYDTAAGQGPTEPIAADLAGLTLTPGVYNSATAVGLTGELTLDAGGDPSAVFVFQAGSSLTTSSGSQVTLTNGAQACNVFWQVGSSATLGTNSDFRGSILALTSITLTTGATVEGRVLARNGAVTLDTNTITRPVCATTPGTTPAAGSGVGGTPATGSADAVGALAPSQVTAVPTGSVSAGDGSSEAATGSRTGVLLGVLALGGFGSAALLVARRRQSDV